jgi:hypothetical protein
VRDRVAARSSRSVSSHARAPPRMELTPQACITATCGESCVTRRSNGVVMGGGGERLGALLSVSRARGRNSALSHLLGSRESAVSQKPAPLYLNQYLSVRRQTWCVSRQQHVLQAHPIGSLCSHIGAPSSSRPHLILWSQRSETLPQRGGGCNSRTITFFSHSSFVHRSFFSFALSFCFGSSFIHLVIR